jgi:hypothetical protein
LSTRRLKACRASLLDALVSHAGDDYPQVADRCHKALIDCQQKVDGVEELLEERIYDLATRLPRLLDTKGQWAEL